MRFGGIGFGVGPGGDEALDGVWARTRWVIKMGCRDGV